MRAHELARVLLQGLDIEVNFTYHDASYGETFEVVEEVKHVPAQKRKIYMDTVEQPEMIVLS